MKEKSENLGIKKFDLRVFDEYQDIINEKNKKRLNLIVVIEGVLNLALLLFSIILMNSEFHVETKIHLFNVAWSILFIIIIKVLLTKKPKYTVLIFYIYIIVSLITYKLIGIDYTPNATSSFISAVMVAYSLMIVDKPTRYSTVMILFTIWVCISAIMIKTPVIALSDCINTIIFCVGSCILNYYMVIERLNTQILLKQVKNQRDTDSLTHLINRFKSEEEIERYLEKNNDKINAMFVIDLDNFKKANDTYGHKYGDEILISVGKILTKAFRKTDFVSRIGGDEFVVFVTDLPNKKFVDKKAKELIENIKKLEQGNKTGLGCSIGIAFSNNEDNYHTLFVKADEAMYKAKKIKNNYEIY